MPITNEDKKKELFEKSQISLWMDSYTEIFSDFDPRPFSERSISDDFLIEAKKSAKENLSGKIDLKLLMPADKRNKTAESIIKKRLKEYFTYRYNLLDAKRKRLLVQGITFVLFGVFFMVLTTFILQELPKLNFFITLAAVIGEPAGWFLFWEGLYTTVFESKERKSDLDFNKRMSKINISFESY